MPEEKKDSALYRAAANVGFNARVEPMWYTFERLSARMGFLEKWRNRRRLKRVVAQINARLAKEGAAADRWDRTPGECVCNLRVARMGLLAEFRSNLGAALDSAKVSAWRHLMAQNDRAALCVPIDFPEPFTVAPGIGEDALQVTSSVRLAAELAEVNRELRIEETFALAKMSKIDYMDATEREISAFESKYATLDDFWPKFAYILLKKLAEKSVEHKMPVHFA